ncbi:unnamed protein product [Euphydryas editha]|uniref:Uncharacterized protein n=1 Tax=Euphydryas editha TaxID=104508 RepID=A0AAU9V4P3_EUPED|nr:unnamed protein product [Euphydryas editha]
MSFVNKHKLFDISKKPKYFQSKHLLSLKDNFIHTSLMSICTAIDHKMRATVSLISDTKMDWAYYAERDGDIAGTGEGEGWDIETLETTAVRDERTSGIPMR